MTPAEQVVIAAAEAYWAYWERWDQSADLHNGLMEAVAALQLERAGAAPHVARLTYGQVVEGDEIANEAGKFFAVRHAVHADGVSQIGAKGIPKLFKRPSGREVTVRRGPTGQAVDMFASTLWSMPDRPAERVEEISIELDITQDPAAAEPQKQEQEES
jgi:hypothetical protein